MSELSFSAEDLLRYSQQIKLPGIGISGQKKLKEARVLCVGLGGLGSPLLLYLAAAGVGTIGIIDDDVVEISNLHRQIVYRSSQLGEQKAHAAKEQLLALNPTIQVDVYAERLTNKNAAKLISQYDIIADGSDNFDSHFLIHDYCFQLNKTYVYASASQFAGYCAIFDSQQGPCLRCLFPEISSSDCQNCSDGGVLGVLPGLLGVIQATEIIKWILKLGDSLEKQLLIVDLLTMSFKKIKLSQNPDCKLCIHHQLPAMFSAEHRVLDLKKYAIAPMQLETYLQAENITLVDVRSAQEHAEYNIGGKLIPLAELTQRLHELETNHTIILYCYSGKRSIEALNVLLDAGFASVKYLLHGISILNIV